MGADDHPAKDTGGVGEMPCDAPASVCSACCNDSLHLRCDVEERFVHPAALQRAETLRDPIEGSEVEGGPQHTGR
eukprot:1178223-Prorocentrum_minimum.AAC.2